MKIKDLTNLQLQVLADNDPVWVLEYVPAWMAYNNPYLLINCRPDWVAENLPDWVAGKESFWRNRKEKYWLATSAIQEEVPDSILRILRGESTPEERDRIKRLIDNEIAKGIKK